MRCIPAIFLASLTIFGLSQVAFSQQPISKGDWSYKNGKPESVTFDYGTELTAEDIERISAFDSIARISMGYAGIDSEHVTIEGDLLKLGRLKNLEDVHLNKDGIVTDDLEFIALLPRIHTLEFNAKNGEGGCTDRCADSLSSAKTLRKLRIFNGQFTDEFVSKITQGLPDLEELMLSSPELTDESLRLLAERCKQLKSLSIGSDHFTAEGLKHLDSLKNLEERSVSSPSLRWENEAEFWLHQAESACDEIEDGDAADHAFARLHAVYIQWGEIASAEKITQRINNREQRARAHIAIARHYAEAGNEERCKLELNLANPLAVHSRLRDELVEAWLQLAKSPPLAISFISEEHDDPKAREKLCEALARHGHLDVALKIAENEKDDRKQLTLKQKTALAAAKAARIEDTERAVKRVLSSDGYEGDGQGIWCELALALYENGDMESARKYAARVTDEYTIRTTRDLRRIMEGVPADAPYVTRSRSEASDTLNAKLLQTGDPDEAKRILEAAIANAEQNPIESTTGQFGPWNQTAQLAKLRLGYAYVAVLYRKAGNQINATKATELADQAIQSFVKESSFIAMLSLSDLYRMQIAMDDIEGLIHSTAATDPGVWLMWTDPIVSKVLSSGDVDGAKNIARRALSAKTGLGSLPGSERSEVISCFMEAGETQAAHELVKASELAGLTAAACENAGRAMIETDRGQLLRTSKWQHDIGAFQRAYLSIGAAIMAKENSNSD